MKFFLSLLLFVSTQANAVEFDKDVPEAIKKQFSMDYDLVTNLQSKGATPLHQKIFGTVSGASYKSFFEERITFIGMDDCGGSPGVVACVQPFFGAHTMWLSPNFIKFNLPQMARIMILFHEARHTEGKNGNWSHASCPVPFLDDNGKDVTGLFSGAKLEGQAACDSTPFGSYGSSTIMSKNIAKHCTNCSQKTVMDSELLATDQIKRIIHPKAKKEMLEDFEKP